MGIWMMGMQRTKTTQATTTRRLSFKWILGRSELVSASVLNYVSHSLALLLDNAYGDILEAETCAHRDT